MKRRREMGRHKEYDTQKVLDAATLEFLDKGYKGASVNDLVKATKLNKHSMYQEFGSKDGLFSECLDNYVRAIDQGGGHVLRRQPLGLANIEEFFRYRLDYAYARSGNGCLLVTTVVERSQLGEMALKLLEYHWDLQKADFELCLRAAQVQGHIPKEKHIKGLTNYLFALLVGVLVMVKGGADRPSIDEVVGLAMVSVRR
ncbi:related to transcriptional regulator [Desulfotalea psychrophila LSv54]|uniref:Related to transcriptional regulator n=2 Tax=Desulfotalea psychrophila TaxID=84980 RepID=Q6AJP0_DESPS|nr:related to transcriptional regulator [Desulfotalea psychrophila LSv54]